MLVEDFETGRLSNQTNTATVLGREITSKDISFSSGIQFIQNFLESDTVGKKKIQRRCPLSHHE